MPVLVASLDAPHRSGHRGRMPLAAQCPRCPVPLIEGATDARTWSCPDHGRIDPLWRTTRSAYDDFTHHLRTSGGFPTYLPWPLRPGWQVSDFGVVGPGGDSGARPRPRATVAGVTGPGSDQEGPVEVLVVAEEPGTGLGARCAGTVHSDPGDHVAASDPVTRIKIGPQGVPLWIVSTADADAEWDRTVLAGEAGGRWLWLVLRPAATLFLLRDGWEFADISALGAPLLDVPFGGAPPAW